MAVHSGFLVEAGAGVVAGVDTEDWIQSAPEIPGICLRMAAQVVEEPDAGSSRRRGAAQKGGE
ncbi:MAG: hypothetical protein WCD21_11895 [Streptomyces sp.]